MIRALFLFLFLTALAYGQTETQRLTLSQDDQIIYDEVASMCDGNTPRAYTEKARVWYSSFNTGIIHSIVSQTSPLHVSPHLERLMSSVGFYLAMNRCFGADENQKLLFFTMLLGLDISGKLTNWALGISLLKTLYSAMTLAVPTSSSMFTTIIEKLKFFSKLQFREPLFWKLSYAHFAFGLILGEVGNSFYREYLIEKEKIELSTQEEKQKIVELENNIERFKKKMLLITEKNDLEMLKYFIQCEEREIERLKRRAS